MERRRPRRRERIRRAIAPPVLVLALALIATVFPLAGVASVDHDDCRISAGGPFLYAGMVFANSVVEATR